MTYHSERRYGSPTGFQFARSWNTMTFTIHFHVSFQKLKKKKKDNWKWLFFSGVGSSSVPALIFFVLPHKNVCRLQMTSLGCGDFGIYVFCIIQGHQDQKLAFCNSSKNPFLYRASIKFIPKKCQFDSGDPVLFFYTTYSNRFFFKILLSHSRLIIHKRGQLIESMITYYLNITILP